MSASRPQSSPQETVSVNTGHTRAHSAVPSLADSIETLSDSDSQSQASAPVAYDLPGSNQSSISQRHAPAETIDAVTTSPTVASANSTYSHTGGLYSTVLSPEEVTSGLAEAFLPDLAMSPASLANQSAYPTELDIAADPEDQAPNKMKQLSPAMEAWLDSRHDSLQYRLYAAGLAQERAE